MNKSPEKRIKQLNFYGKNILVIAMFLSLCSFSETVQARTGIPDNLIETKENTINELSLGASQGITLNRTYTPGTESINLNWTSVPSATKYTIYQSKNGGTETTFTVQDTTVTLDKYNAGIKDEAAPTMPVVTATQNASQTGYNISVASSTDNGTTYRHTIYTTVRSDIQYVEGDMEQEAIKNGLDSITTRGTFTVPAGVTRIRVACVGGGGGDSSHNSGVDNGEDSFFGSVRATGGTASSVGSPNGLSYKGRRDGYGFAKSFTMTVIPSGYGSAYDNYYPHTSGSGGYISTYLNVTPGEQIAWQAGRGSHKGQGGYVLIAYGGEIQPETTYKSNTVSTTVTTGIKGYQYAITTSSEHTFTNEEIVQISDIPTYISGEEQMVQYLHIRAVDNSGNASATNSILLQVPAKIKLKTTYQYGMNYVPLEWTINDKRTGYVYRLYQREDGQETFVQIPSTNSTEIIKEQGTKSASYTTPGTYTWTVPAGVTQVKVAAVGGGAGGLTVVDGAYGSKGTTTGPEGMVGTAGSGGNSRFGDFVAEGGKGASGRARLRYFIEVNQGVAAYPNGRLGETKTGINWDRPGYTCWANPKNPVRGATGFAIGFTMANGSYGAGGNSGHYYDSDMTNAQIGAGGNSGAYNVGYVNVTPGQKIQIVVGAGGKGVKNENDGQYGRYDVTNGTGGYVYIEYTYTIKEPILYGNTTNDISAKDKFAPNILELYLNGILGDESKYEIGIVTEDYGTTYEHYVVGTNEKYDTEITSNILETEVISGLKGYSWKMDTNPTGEPDNIIGYDNDNNTTTTLPKTIASSYLDKGYYLHVKPIDNAGNIGRTVHLKLESVSIRLRSHYNEYADSNGYGPNYVPLTWTNSHPNDKFFYKLFQKDENKSNWAQVSTNYGKPVKVLNVYPNVGNQLKGWMQNYGLGLITVDEVRITDFNSNPTAYLKSGGQYKYDVIMFGSWDCNNGYDLSWSAARATEEFIISGRGVLFGHDTICDYGGMGHHNFNYLAKYIKATPTKSVARIGSSTVKVIKKGFLTKYPYDIETRNLTVPYCHTSGVKVPEELHWVKFKEIGGPLTDGEDEGYNNYYLASWNNCAFIRTGHSNGAATPDEQKIIANTLFYLGQVTEDSYANVYTAEDKAAPQISNVQISDDKKQNSLQYNIEGIDYGTSYEHYVAALKLKEAGTYYSNTVHTVVKTGIQKFQYTINNSATSYSGTEYEVGATNKEKCVININKGYIGQYLHIRAVDIAGNVGGVTHIYIDGARTISKEEKDSTEELYCIEEDVLIPAENDGTQQDATIEIAGNREVLRWPLNIQKLFELYKDDGAALRNPYTVSGLNGFVDKSNSLGRYLVTSVPGTQPGKSGNASEAYAYILAHYNDNTTENSDSQNALYEIIAEEEGRSGDTTRRNTLYYEAKEYAKYRELLKQKGGFFNYQVTHNVRVGYNIENKQFIVGPFEVNYIRNYSTITDNKGNKKKIEFSGIGVTSGITITNKNGIRIYDQNGNEIPQNSWTIEYDNKTEKEKTRTETYGEYNMPLPGEEFYIKLNRKGNENVTEISKIEVQYYEMEADAQYRLLSGVYNTVEWKAGGDANKCEGGTMCPHDREYPHTVGHTYYVKSEIIAANVASQKLLEVQWANLGYKTHIQTLTITATKGTNNDSGNNEPDNSGTIEDKIRLTMDFSGDIWNDQSENTSNGLKEIGEQGIKGVEVFLIDKYTNKQVDYTVTDEKGEYIFKQVPVGIYYIQYTYDGQTYRTTKSFVKGTVENYRENGNGKAYNDISIVDETDSARQTLNNKFYEIKENEAIGTNGKVTTKLNYKEIGNISKIITREEGTEKAYQAFQIQVDTKEKEIYFPATNTIVINGTPYLLIDDNNNINVGLSEREKTDTNLQLDVYQTTLEIKGQRQSFLHNGREIRNPYSNKVVNEYIQKINPDDYYWRLEDYKDKVSDETYQNIINIYGSNEDEVSQKLELETYVEYIIIIRNTGNNDTAYITELADYFDTTLIYDHQYRDFDKSSWIVIRNDDETESTYTGNNKQEQIYWSDKSRYGGDNEYKNFQVRYANLQEYGIKKGQYAEIHLIFKVAKDNDGNIMLDKNEGKRNAAEINGYRTLETATGKVAGLIDLDSKPGDLNPNEESGVYEDDEDKAPYYKLQLSYEGNSENGNNGSGNGNQNGGTGENVQIDENGNPIGFFGNTIEGNVWEDFKGEPLEEDGRRISNGIKDEKEPLINDIRVELYETISGTNKDGKYQELEINLCEKQTIRTKETFLLSDNNLSNGAYRFSNLTSGKYNVHFIYGEAEQLYKDAKLKYNGQDYQAISSAKINKTDKIAGSYEDTEIMLVIDNSNSMSGTKIEEAKGAANKLIADLKNRLPGAQIGAVNFNEIAGTIGKVDATTAVLKNGIDKLTAGGETAIGRGITQGINGFIDGKLKLMVLITDGQETVETEESVINKIEELRDNNIKLVTLLTSQSENIFGTKQNPRYGKLYQIEESSTISSDIVEQIYQEVISQSEIETDRSLGDDLEGTQENPERETRWYQINRYSEMNHEKSAELDIEGISKITNETDKQKAIETLEEHTAMRSVTKQIEIFANKLGTGKVHEVNQALVERPKAELKLVQDIGGIKVTLSDGTVLIDTVKGLSKNVMGLDIEDTKLPISIYMDEEIMQGSTIEVIYKLKVVNTGEVDRLSNYFEGASTDTITTTAKVIYAYLNNSIVYRGEDNKQLTETGELSEVWKQATEKEWELDLSKATIAGLKDVSKITLRTTSLDEQELYPILSKEVKSGIKSAKTEVGVDLILSKIISPEDDTSTSLTYDCTMELTLRGNKAGRRVINSRLGDYKPVSLKDKENGTKVEIKTDPDETTARSIIITKPFGENRNIKSVLIALSILTTIATVIIILKHKKTESGL